MPQQWILIDVGSIRTFNYNSIRIDQILNGPFQILTSLYVVPWGIRTICAMLRIIQISRGRIRHLSLNRTQNIQRPQFFEQASIQLPNRSELIFNAISLFVLWSRTERNSSSILMNLWGWWMILWSWCTLLWIRRGCNWLCIKNMIWSVWDRILWILGRKIVL